MRSARRGPSAVRANAGGRGTGCAPAIAAAVAGASDSEKTPPMWSSRADVPASLDSATATTLFSCARCLFRVAENDFGIVAATYTGGTSTHLGDFARPQPRTILVGQNPGSDPFSILVPRISILLGQIPWSDPFSILVPRISILLGQTPASSDT